MLTFFKCHPFSCHKQLQIYSNIHWCWPILTTTSASGSLEYCFTISTRVNASASLWSIWTFLWYIWYFPLQQETLPQLTLNDVVQFPQEPTPLTGQRTVNDDVLFPPRQPPTQPLLGFSVQQHVSESTLVPLNQLLPLTPADSTECDAQITALKFHLADEVLLVGLNNGEVRLKHKAGKYQVVIY